MVEKYTIVVVASSDSSVLRQISDSDANYSCNLGLACDRSIYVSFILSLKQIHLNHWLHKVYIIQKKTMACRVIFDIITC